jgi:hypothetical protein
MCCFRFEVTSYKCFKEFLPRCSFFGCIFHLGQIIWRRFKLLKFSTLFVNNFDVKFHVKLILPLSFVPIEHVYTYADRLETYLRSVNSLEVIKLFEWFKGEYLTTENSNKNIGFWNVYTRTKNNIPRTMNSIEGFHRHLNTLVLFKQSSLIFILNELINEQEITE